GDSLDLVEAVKNLSTIEAMDWSRSWLGWPPREPPRSKKQDTGTAGGNGKAQPENKVTGARKALLLKADEIEPESINWAWKNRFAFGKVAIVAGDPGLGNAGNRGAA